MSPADYVQFQWHFLCCIVFHRVLSGFFNLIFLTYFALLFHCYYFAKNCLQSVTLPFVHQVEFCSRG